MRLFSQADVYKRQDILSLQMMDTEYTRILKTKRCVRPVSYTHLTYGKSQREALFLLDTPGIKVLTGGPGTGKTTTLNGILTKYIFEHPVSYTHLGTFSGEIKIILISGKWNPHFRQKYFRSKERKNIWILTKKNIWILTNSNVTDACYHIGSRTTFIFLQCLLYAARCV